MEVVLSQDVSLDATAGIGHCVRAAAGEPSTARRACPDGGRPGRAILGPSAMDEPRRVRAREGLASSAVV